MALTRTAAIAALHHILTYILEPDIGGRMRRHSGQGFDTIY